ncbi:hypothetical protein SAY87_011102 [Trapa incisa]|uniref:Uncharacterized protein n=1 Tax=Trapa incisa TaxID=236973 RepID=A0AAN7JIV0_9MYRT|nr:hypothetical protein SAY87_011102 [Trapa incisa]
MREDHSRMRKRERGATKLLYAPQKLIAGRKRYDCKYPGGWVQYVDKPEEDQRDRPTDRRICLSIRTLDWEDAVDITEGGRKPNKEEAFQPIKEETNRLVYSSQKFTRQRIEQSKLILASVLSSNDILQMKKAHYALAQIQPRVVSFEEQVLVIRETLAELYESEQQWSKVAQMLSVIKPRFRLLESAKLSMISSTTWPTKAFWFLYDTYTHSCHILFGTNSKMAFNLMGERMINAEYLPEFSHSHC